MSEAFRQGFREVCLEEQDDNICIAMGSDNTQAPFVTLDILNKFQYFHDVVIASKFTEAATLLASKCFE